MLNTPGIQKHCSEMQQNDGSMNEGEAQPIFCVAERCLQNQRC